MKDNAEKRVGPFIFLDDGQWPYLCRWTENDYWLYRWTKQKEWVTVRRCSELEMKMFPRNLSKELQEFYVNEHLRPEWERYYGNDAEKIQTNTKKDWCTQEIDRLRLVVGLSEKKLTVACKKLAEMIGKWQFHGNAFTAYQNGYLAAIKDIAKDLRELEALMAEKK